MDPDTTLLGPLSLADLAALGWLFLAWFSIGWATEHPPRDHPSVTVLMKAHRREWMRQFITRNPRIFDSAILTTLREGTAFFASACLIAIGGGLALIGNTDQLAGVARQFDLGHIPALKWEIKIVVALFFVANALLRFIWSHRLFGYCAIIMASVPNEPEDPRALPLAMQAADINITAAKSFNSGLRCVYFSLAALGWLAGPLGLFLSTVYVLFISWRREFASRSRRAIMKHVPGETRLPPGEPKREDTGP
ncbi:DUF599 family protein [Paracoccus kondratievae]|uniref:Membrane protein n=1 Tax=Paracoccus kondratievae TaxID=135740 RepID=A0AAD3RVQ2_9RHOB|nr:MULTISPECIES: DUF599 domain-containing protein [Paracoccus]QFQ88195.1 DUF599 family protein [Paracoccus kondratievae]GLK65971.1 membrane protein [Paracoccus kondratievae]SMG44295.1 Uncharacterized membrane protein [Paracoccus sp. J56]